MNGILPGSPQYLPSVFSLGSVKHSPVEQSWPVQLGSQLQVPVSARNAPCPEHWSMQEARGLSHPGPPQPTKQWHSPLTQTPRPEHVGSRQSTERDPKGHRQESGHLLFPHPPRRHRPPPWRANLASLSESE